MLGSCLQTLNGVGGCRKRIGFGNRNEKNSRKEKREENSE